MHPIHRLSCFVSTLLAQAVLCAGPGCALVPAGEGTRERYEHAYYLHHGLGKRAEALAAYRAVAAEKGADPALVQDAERAARGLSEDLAAADLAALMPPDALAYVELCRPGARLGMLLAELGLAGESGRIGERFGVSPLLVDALLGLEGAALCVTEVSEQGEPRSGVLIVHPGDHALLRGLLDSALSARASADTSSGGAIGGFPTFVLGPESGGMLVTRTERLYVASPSREAIAGVLARLAGSDTTSLAQSSELRAVLGPHDDTLLAAFVHGEPLRPILARGLEALAASDPEAAKAARFVDPASLAHAALALRVGTEVELDLELQLDQAHQSLAFELLRLPPVRQETLARVPSGAAALLAFSLNPARPDTAGAGTGAATPAGTSLMDFGRELFGNAIDVTLFALPDASASAQAPPLVLAVRSNDVARSEALWSLVLGLAGQPEAASGAETSTLAGLPARRYALAQGEVLSVQRGDELWLGLNRAVLERSLAAREQGSSLATDPAFAAELAALSGDETLVALVQPGRLAQALAPLGPPEEAGAMQVVAALARDTLLALELRQSRAALSLSARLSGLPDLGGLVQAAIGAGAHDTGTDNGTGKDIDAQDELSAR